MYIEKLELQNFKNHTNYVKDFVQGVNAIVGPNGSGKTNVLDGLHFLSTGRSFFFRKDSLCIKHNQEWATIEAELFEGNTKEKWHVGISHSEKRFLTNGTRLKNVSSHIGRLPVVFINPDSTALVKNYQDERIRLINKTLSQVSPDHLKDLMKQKRLIDSRNALLKDFFEQRRYDATELEALDYLLAPVMDRVHHFRKLYIPQWMLEAQNIYSQITESKEVLTIKYESDLLPSESAKNLLEQNTNSHIQARRTLHGTHKDDLQIELNGMSLKQYGSQGQIKAATISLLLGSLVFLKNENRNPPLLLLDDAFEKIDEMRMNRLLNFIDQLEQTQIFITDTDENRVKRNLQNISSTKKIVNIEAQ